MNVIKLDREVQCEKCPWKRSTNPHDIPNGYSADMHANLRGTISSGEFSNCDYIRAMACHESEIGKETYCVGWLDNQLGPGNNLALRMKMMKYDLRGLTVVGRQHSRFEDTLPDAEN